MLHQSITDALQQPLTVRGLCGRGFEEQQLGDVGGLGPVIITLKPAREVIAACAHRGGNRPVEEIRPKGGFSETHIFLNIADQKLSLGVIIKLPPLGGQIALSSGAATLPVALALCEVVGPARLALTVAATPAVAGALRENRRFVELEDSVNERLLELLPGGGSD